MLTPETVALFDALLHVDGDAVEHNDGYTLQLVVWPNNPGPKEGELWLHPSQLKKPDERQQTLSRLVTFLDTYKRQPLLMRYAQRKAPPKPGQKRRGLSPEQMKLSNCSVDRRFSKK